MEAIQAHEVRIGNYYQWDGEGKFLQIGIEQLRKMVEYKINRYIPIPLTEDLLLRMGFFKIPHFTISNSMTIDLGRNRQLSIGCVGTPNEMLWLQELDQNDPQKITDLVCIHNYDYDGNLYAHRLQNIYHSIKNTELTITPKGENK